ncbi:MAG TPA: UDP-N-acetylmuramoyl-L-alanyl-D-glutamate--2,6-diaminopimelate ligase [Armatimonadota bacterium]|nr:UDP-N-acetylmuramoyl-L-alanyl-D-glutamate--2,6-diaminopimelate ligase [Armatimonadota bacterium]
MTLTFSQLTSTAGLDVIRGADADITAITSDSREAGPGACFIAIRGYDTDGHKHIAKAVEAGAAAIVYQDESFAGDIPPATPCARAGDSRRACASVAARFNGHPSNDLVIAGVTGTNGKTTTVLLIEALMTGQGHKTATLGTLGRSFAGITETISRTTPDSIELQSTFAQFRDAGASHVAMEVSSHALSLHRTWETKFDVACFTNLSQDHLDFYDGSMDAYLAAKTVLFTDYAPDAAAINIDDEAGRVILGATAARPITYAVEAPDADVRAEGVSFSPNGATFTLVAAGEREPVDFPLVGRFNVYNALAAAATALALGFPLRDIARDLGRAPVVPGRFEPISEGQSFLVACDYAHTPDALVNVLRAARQVTQGRLLCVFGCGGDRDKTKRPLMAEAVCEAADVAIVTADNPRSEDPLDIIADMAPGLRADRRDVHIEPDRRKAIELGVALCEPGDTLMVCGKGHEPYQEFAHETIHFDDREEARKALQARAK